MRARDRSEWVFIVLLMVLTLLALRAEATDRDEVEVSTGDNTAANSVTTGSSRAYGLSHSLGDVDINDCLASTQWGTIIVSRQRVVLNRWCAAEVYDFKGLHDMAALMRCGIPEIAEYFGSESACIEANTVEPEIERGNEDRHAEDVNAITARLNALEERNQSLQEEYAALERRRQIAARQSSEERERERERAREALSGLEGYR